MKSIGSKWILALAIAILTAALPAAPVQAGKPGAAVETQDSEVSAKPDHQRHYVPPITSAIYNETARITTEIRPFYMYHVIPGSFVTNGGHVNIVAVQLRAAITERLGFIATKDGYADMNFASSSPVSDDDGFVNIAAGFKYAFYADPDKDAFATLGLRYEAPSGDLDAGPISVQGGGDGFLDTFLTAERMVGPLGVQGSFGVNMALDGDHDSSFIHSSIHTDLELIKNIFGVFEVNMISTVDHGNRTDGSVFGSFEGYDVINFGNTKSGTMFTVGTGARARITDNVLFGVSYEVPLGTRKDIFNYRWTADFVFVL